MSSYKGIQDKGIRDKGAQDKGIRDNDLRQPFDLYFTPDFQELEDGESRSKFGCFSDARTEPSGSQQDLRSARAQKNKQYCANWRERKKRDRERLEQEVERTAAEIQQKHVEIQQLCSLVQEKDKALEKLIAENHQLRAMLEFASAQLNYSTQLGNGN